MPRDRSSTSSKPAHWPYNIEYISKQYYHTSVTKDILSHLNPTRPNPSAAVTLSKPPVVIREITERSHPACGQHGLFACKKIPPRAHIIDYVGEVHCDDRPDSDYDLSLYHAPNGLSVGVDASKRGNEARFINDYRGVQPKPNALFEERRTANGELCMSVWSGCEGIKKGDEVLVSYGKGFWKARLSTPELQDSPVG